MAKKGKKKPKKQEKPEILASGEFLENKVVVWKKWEPVYSEKYFGKIIKEGKMEYLQLSLPEAMLLLERGYLDIKTNKKKVSLKDFYKKCCEIDREFPQKYAVYRDLRNRGFIVKSGFKFGTHFRVYERGVNPYKMGPKEKKEHTKFNVHSFPENFTCSYAELSRFVRLSQNIRAKALMAVVDEEGDVTYYLIRREAL